MLRESRSGAGTSGSGASTTVASSAVAHVAGRGLVVVVSGQTSGSAPTGIADTAGDAFNLVGSYAHPGNSNYLYIYKCDSTNGHASNVVTVTFASSVLQRSITVYEYSGQDSASFLNTTSTGGNTSGTTISAGTISLVAAEEAIVAMMELDAGGTPTGVGAFAGRVFVPINFFASMDAIVTSNTTPQATTGSSAKWEILAASFKAASGGAPVEGTLAGTFGNFTGTMAGNAGVTGGLDGEIDELVGTLAGLVGVQGSMVGSFGEFQGTMQGTLPDIQAGDNYMRMRRRFR